jgi:cytochrome c-type biogenesis protein CcmH/NrfG
MIMVCTKCGAELKDTDLFCLNCGMEIQIVPDYNPVEEIVVKNLAEAQQNEIKIENANESQTQTQNNEISDKTKKIDHKKIKIKTNDKDKNIHKEQKNHKKIYVLVTIVVLAVILSIAATAFWNIHKKSFEYQYAQAVECINNENYEESLIHLENALKTNSSDMNTRILMSSVYIELGNINKAIEILKETLDLEPNNTKASKQLIELYSEYKLKALNYRKH